MDSAAAIVASLQGACRDLDFPVPRDEDARYIIGLGLDDALAHVLPGLDAAEYPARGRSLPASLSRARRRHRAVSRRRRSHRGAARSRLPARNSDRQEPARSRRARSPRPGSCRYFHASRCADEGHSKPHPGMLQAVMRELGARNDRTLMIGDTTHDLEMARAAGVAALGVAYGAHAHEALLALSPLACRRQRGGAARLARGSRLTSARRGRGVYFVPLGSAAARGGRTNHLIRGESDHGRTEYQRTATGSARCSKKSRWPPSRSSGARATGASSSSCSLFIYLFALLFIGIGWIAKKDTSHAQAHGARRGAAA